MRAPSGLAQEARPATLRQQLAAHLGSRDVTRVVYGAVVGLALVLALEDHPPSAAAVAGALAGTALAVGLAELYSEVVGTEARTRRMLDRRQVRALTADALAVVLGAGFPAVFFAVAATGAIGRATAFALSKWTGAGLICLYGFAAARLAGLGVPRALLHAAAVGLIGAALIGLKALLH